MWIPGKVIRVLLEARMEFIDDDIVATLIKDDSTYDEHEDSSTDDEVGSSDDKTESVEDGSAEDQIDLNDVKSYITGLTNYTTFTTLREKINVSDSQMIRVKSCDVTEVDEVVFAHFPPGSVIVLL